MSHQHRKRNYILLIFEQFAAEALMFVADAKRNLVGALFCPTTLGLLSWVKLPTAGRVDVKLAGRIHCIIYVITYLRISLGLIIIIAVDREERENNNGSATKKNFQ
ncbi:hypothetical protein M9H77_09388 [Catharanthus roseus]|uniref:Uncharacterized protein n=1 Tax=Catharanthus roseus TaxID=4058 RepID=A0ACC0C0V7_CATRO|nr:hypothetical protein M9H77_09388 [Catharanthus roseus]